jgi:hypothetical protein
MKIDKSEEENIKRTTTEELDDAKIIYESYE